MPYRLADVGQLDPASILADGLPDMEIDDTVAMFHCFEAVVLGDQVLEGVGCICGL